MRNVVVTGGSRGLGLAIAIKLAASEYRVIVMARSETVEFRRAAEDCMQEKRGELVFRSLDLAETEAIPNFIRGLRKEFGSFYGLVNNAGIGTSGILATMRDTDVERLMLVNVTSLILLTKYVLRSMMTEGGGRIVNISSIVGTTGHSGLSVYSATKAALCGFTKSLAREVGQLNITVNAVAPGFVDTAMTAGLGEVNRERIVRRSALKRLVNVEDVADAVNYLFSDAANNITGVILPVDAGGSA